MRVILWTGLQALLEANRILQQKLLDIFFKQRRLSGRPEVSRVLLAVCQIVSASEVASMLRVHEESHTAVRTFVSWRCNGQVAL